MQGLWDIILRLFDQLPDTSKVALILALIAGLMALSIWKYAGWRHGRDLQKQLSRLNEQLGLVSREREELLKRFESLDIVDDHVWKRPDQFCQNRFVDRNKRKTRFIAFCNLKGGVGKTTVMINTGVSLALQGKRVLLVDLDFQGTISNSLVDRKLLKEYRDKGWTTDVLLIPETSTEVLRTHVFPVSDVSKCRAMIANESLELKEFEQQARFFVDAGKEARFLIQKLFHTEAVFQEYDYVFFDCPPRMSTACINALTCADYVLLPTSLSQDDIEAVPRTLNWMKELRTVLHADFLGVVISRCKMIKGRPPRFQQGQLEQLKELIQRHFPQTDHVFQTIIPDSPEIFRSKAMRKPVVLESQDARRWFDGIGREMERRMQL